MSGSRLGFLRVTDASLRAEGTEPVDREECMTERMSGQIAGRQALTNVVGRGSSAQVAIFMQDSVLL